MAPAIGTMPGRSESGTDVEPAGVLLLPAQWHLSLRRRWPQLFDEAVRGLARTGHFLWRDPPVDGAALADDVGTGPIEPRLELLVDFPLDETERPSDPGETVLRGHHGLAHRYVLGQQVDPVSRPADRVPCRG